MASVISKTKIREYEEFGCEIECIAIIANCSSLTKTEFLVALKRPNPSLGDVGVSDTSAERRMRPRINKLIRRPAGKPDIAPGSFSASTKVAAVVHTACL